MHRTTSTSICSWDSQPEMEAVRVTSSLGRRFRWCGTSPRRTRFAVRPATCVSHVEWVTHGAGAAVRPRRSGIGTSGRRERNGRTPAAAHQHRSAVLRQHRLLRSVGLLLRLAAAIAARRLPRPPRHDARSEGRGAGREPVPARRQGRGASSSSRTASGDVFANARSSRHSTTSRSRSTTPSSRVETRRRRGGVDGLGDAARGDDPRRAGRSPRPGQCGASWATDDRASAPTPSRRRSCLSLRPRPTDAPTTDRRGFIAALEAELPDALRKLQQGQIAPVDLPQAAIGPGMAVFSRYSAVLETGRHEDDRSVGAGADQRDPRPGAERAGGRLRRRHPGSRSRGTASTATAWASSATRTTSRALATRAST